VTVVPSAARATAGERLRPHARSWAPWLVQGCYLLASLVMTWRLWASPASRTQGGDLHDVDLFAWFLRYEAIAISHGHLPPLVTTALNAPQGVSLMWNTSLLLPGILLTPLTLLAGPQVSLNLLLTLGFAGSAASLFFVLRQWRASLGAAALGGAVYGFSEAMVNSGIGHYHMQFAVLPPLMIHVLLRIVTGRGRPTVNGAWLGLLAAAQLLTGEELLIDTALAGLVLLAVLAVSHPRAVRGRARALASGLGTGAVLALAVCGYPLWIQFRGPLSEHSHLLGPYAGNLRGFVLPPYTLVFHTSASAAAADHHVSEYLGYLGWPLLILLAAATVWFWRDVRVRTAAVTWAGLELCSLGGATVRLGWFSYPGWLLPWHWLQGLPGLAEVLPDRFSILADGAAAAVLAFSLDLACCAAPQASRWSRRAIAAAGVLALVPLLPLPYGASAIPPVPAGWQATFTRLRLAPDARVLVLPLPYGYQTLVMRWQAETGEPGSLVGGYMLGPGPGGEATFSPGRTIPAAEYLDRLGRPGIPATAPMTAMIRDDLGYWRPAAVVAVTSAGSPLGQVLVSLLGRPALTAGQVLAWRYPVPPARASNSCARCSAGQPAS
jgi:hypothetical protein